MSYNPATGTSSDQSASSNVGRGSYLRGEEKDSTPEKGISYHSPNWWIYIYHGIKGSRSYLTNNQLKVSIEKKSGQSLQKYEEVDEGRYSSKKGPAESTQSSDFDKYMKVTMRLIVNAYNIFLLHTESSFEKRQRNELDA